jgi:hypothetical protein
MKLRTIYTRFYRSLNFDYVRASADEYEPDPWDETDEGPYPFVRLLLRPDITTVVGGNESGKTQVLNAIRGALTGSGYERSDFCRYSRFFGVDDKLLMPEFGAVFDDVSPADSGVLAEMLGGAVKEPVGRVAVFRMNTTPQHRIYVRTKDGWSDPVHIKTPTKLKLLGVPVPFKIDAEIPLPDSVPIAYLAEGKATAAIGREFLRAVWDAVQDNRSWFESNETVASKAGKIAEIFRPVRAATEEEILQFDLAADLLLQVAGLKRDLFVQLQEAVRTKNGYASSIVDTINAELAKSLDFPHWWSQDSKFELFVALFEFDLVFMIRDRTGRSYGFDERSDGLKYFLSYFVQYLAHEPPDDGSPEILLMDEPDRFLSSSGQQDLLRVFEDFAFPNDTSRQSVQVVYVTHSPFLIDKNESDRIRVLDKGEYDEGTRVVRNASANHYEPLRSAFGSFVAETAFIGSCNLMLEGPSDQVLIAGISRALHRREVSVRDRLDLNTITLVPAGGTRHIPYLVYLARGRDVEKPPVIVLLDADDAGDSARDDLRAGGAYGNQLLDDDLVLQLGDPVLGDLQTENPAGVVGIEDLVPLSVGLEAAHQYCQEFVPDVDVRALALTATDVYGSHVSKSTNRGTLKLIEIAIRTKAERPKFHLDKVGFARAVVDVVGLTSPGDGAEVVLTNFGLLLRELGKIQRTAVRRTSVDRISSRINRTKRDFTRTHKSGARKEAVNALIEEISNQLDASRESELVRATMASWENRFQLTDGPRDLVEDYDGLMKAIRSLAYKAVRESSVAEDD